MRRTQLYSIILMACGSGLIWLWIQYPQPSSGQTHDIGVCLIKQVTNVPCPSCGATRSIFALVEGQFLTSLQWNPFGFLIALVMLISPLWIVFDLLFKKESFLRFYHGFEKQIRSRWIAIPAIALVLANWIWNICKGL